MIELGERIRKARMELGLSLAQVARTDFSRAFLNQVELGRTRPSMRNLQIIAARLQRPIEYFLTDPKKSATAMELALTEAEARLRRQDAAGAESMTRALLQQPISRELRLRAQAILGEALLRLGRAEDARLVLAEAITLAEALSWPGLTVELYDRMGSVHYLLRVPHQASHWFERALQAYESANLNEPVVKARILGHRANLHYVSGQPLQAIAAYEAAIEAAGHVLDMQGLGGIYEGLALAFQRTGQLSRALGYAQRSLRLYETLNDVRMAAQLRHNMAEILLQQGSAKEAERLFRDGADQLEHVGDTDMRPHLLAGAAEAVLDQDRPDEAAVLIVDALAASVKSTDPLCRLSAERVAGRVDHALGRLTESCGHFEAALRLAGEVGSPMERSRVSYDYARVLEATGDSARALTQYRVAYEARRLAQNA